MIPNKEEKLKSLNDKLNALMQKKGLALPATGVVKNIQGQKSQKNIGDKNGNQKNSGSKKQQKFGEVEEEKKKMVKTKLIKKQKDEKKNDSTLRKAAGVVWEDKSMVEWPENDYRIFVGNLGKETTDDVLATVFKSRYPSFNKAKVIQDKRTGKTRGYGFVSFSQPKDFLNSLKQMNGQYIGNRPAKVIKSSWKDRDINSARNQFLPSDFQTNAKKQTNKVYTDFKYVHPY